MKIACIGAGYFARFHVEAWTRIPDVELVAICDQDPMKAIALAEEFGVGKIVDNITSLLEISDLDAIDIITPPSTHLELCKKIVAKGKDIICQKPLAPSLEEAREIAALAQAGGIRLMVHENFRFQPWYRKIKEILEAGTIGDTIHTIRLQMRTGDGWGDDAYLDRQPYFQKMPRLFIYETGIHYIDVFRFLMGEISSVYARLRKLNGVIAGEDCALVLFDFENGTQGILDGNRYNEPNYPDPRYTFGRTLVEGNRGSIRLYYDGKLTVQLLGEEEKEIKYDHARKNFASDCVYETQKHFVHCIKNNVPFETDATEYLKNLVVQDAIYESSSQRKEVKILSSKNNDVH